jgi:hypothetical protein
MIGRAVYHAICIGIMVGLYRLVSLTVHAIADRIGLQPVANKIGLYGVLGIVFVFAAICYSLAWYFNRRAATADPDSVVPVDIQAGDLSPAHSSLPAPRTVLSIAPPRADQDYLEGSG